MSTDEYVHTVFVDEIKRIAIENGYDPITDPACLLVGFKDKLFTLQEDFSIIENLCGYAAIGGGGDYALGALHILTSAPIDNPKDILEKSLETSTLFSPSVCAPFDFLTTKK